MDGAITLSIDSETGLMEIETSGGKLLLSQLEAALIYITLRKTLGIRGRFKLWRMRKQLRTKVSNTETTVE